MKKTILILLLCVLTSGERTSTDPITQTSQDKLSSISFPDKFYFDRVEENGSIHNYYGFIEIDLGNYIRIKYNERDDFFLIESCELDDDNVYYINVDIIFDVDNKTLSYDNRTFHINSTINSRY